MFSLALLLETYSIERTRHAIKSLIGLSPPIASVKNGIFEIVKPVEQINTSETVILRPGERVPLDGVVVQGTSSVNESLLTGESAPILKQVGHQVYADSINSRGTFEFRVTKLSKDTSLSRKIHLIEET